MPCLALLRLDYPQVPWHPSLCILHHLALILRVVASPAPVGHSAGGGSRLLRLLGAPLASFSSCRLRSALPCSPPALLSSLCYILLA